MPITLPSNTYFEEVSSKELQSQFGRIIDIVKGKKPIAVTQYGRPTVVIFPYDQAVEATKLLAKQRLLDMLDERAKNPPKSLENLTLEELDKMIDDERNQN